MKDRINAIYGNSVRVRSCGICLKDDAILLVRHHGLGNKGTLWIPPGGGIEPGERSVDALQREFREETGLNIEVGSFLFVNEFLQSPLHAIELFFEVKILNGTLISGTDPEMEDDFQIIKEVKFVTFQEISVMDNETLHNILHLVNNKESLLNMRGFFNFQDNCIK